MASFTGQETERRFIARRLRSAGAILACVVLGHGAACAAGSAPLPSTPEAEPRLPALEPGAAPDPTSEAEADRLLSAARDSLIAGHPEPALALARRVIRSHPGAPGSSEGLWIAARSAFDLDRFEDAVSAASRFAERLPPGHELAGPARLLAGRALLAGERRPDALRALLRIPPSASDSIQAAALDVIRRTVAGLHNDELEGLAGIEARGAPRLGAPLLAERALALFGRADTAGARDLAREALEAAGEGPDAELARSILAGKPSVERRQPAVVGVLVPESGSPGQRQMAELVLEGIRARLEGADAGRGAAIRLETRDDRGSPETAGSLTSALVSDGAAGLLGPLADPLLESAARARPEPVPIVSPTAGRTPPGEPGVYTLQGPDPGAGRLLARYALSRDLDDAVVLHSPTHESGTEADAFEEAYEAGGGRILRRLTFEPGATFFEEPLRTVRELRPAALVIPVRPREIELLAPQLTYFGLDTLGIRFLGNGAWAEAGVLDEIATRHTDGFVVATPRTAGPPPEAYTRFVEEYERVARRTLRSPIPALGYDAAGLLVEALATGARSPRSLRDALERIGDFPGATGSLSIVDGEVRRRHHLVRLRDGIMIPLPPLPGDGEPPP